ncbi:hypothetical protein Gasu2_61610 [Galdieria sulphuraria]|nr:hypothetical protein Gasu2_61610 [Galdieria sulphuraria]
MVIKVKRPTLDDYKQKNCPLIKEIQPTCSCFKGHFPDNPVFPGVWLLELQFQTAAVYMTQVLGQQRLNVPLLKTCRFRQLVKPLDKLDIVVEAMDPITRVTELNPQHCNFRGTIYRQSKKVAESSFVVEVPLYTDNRTPQKEI